MKNTPKNADRVKCPSCGRMVLPTKNGRIPEHYTPRESVQPIARCKAARMSVDMVPVQSPVPESDDPVIGRFFHSFSDTGEIQWQGQVTARINQSHYLVQLFEWVIGADSTERIVGVDQMTGWTIYRTDEDMRDAYERASRGKQPGKQNWPSVAAPDR